MIEWSVYSKITTKFELCEQTCEQKTSLTADASSLIIAGKVWLITWTMAPFHLGVQ